MNIYVRMTLNCNLVCSHCYCEAGPGNESISIEDFSKVIDNMPLHVDRIKLSGGEPFTKKRLLYSALHYINESKVNVTQLSVQTNGFWAKDKNNVRKTLEELLDLGVTDLDVTSNDSWHKKAGLDLTKPRLLGYIAKEMGLGGLRREGRYKRHMYVSPIGRALELDKKRWSYYKNTGRCFDYVHNDIGIDEKGRVYPCKVMVPGSALGDARVEEIAKIVKNGRRRHPFNILTSRDGARRLAYETGMTKKEMVENPLYHLGGRCGLCLYLFSEGLVKTAHS